MVVEHAKEEETSHSELWFAEKSQSSAIVLLARAGRHAPWARWIYNGPPDRQERRLSFYQFWQALPQGAHRYAIRVHRNLKLHGLFSAF